MFDPRIGSDSRNFRLVRRNWRSSPARLCGVGNSTPVNGKSAGASYRSRRPQRRCIGSHPPQRLEMPLISACQPESTDCHGYIRLFRPACHATPPADHTCLLPTIYPARKRYAHLTFDLASDERRRQRFRTPDPQGVQAAATDTRRPAAWYSSSAGNRLAPRAARVAPHGRAICRWGRRQAHPLSLADEGAGIERVMFAEDRTCRDRPYSDCRYAATSRISCGVRFLMMPCITGELRRLRWITVSCRTIYAAC